MISRSKQVQENNEPLQFLFFSCLLYYKDTLFYVILSIYLLKIEPFDPYNYRTH